MLTPESDRRRQRIARLNFPGTLDDGCTRSYRRLAAAAARVERPLGHRRDSRHGMTFA
jgi:hypothetical protein